jgi:uncharacterized protein
LPALYCNGKVIAADVEVAAGMLQKTKGLLGRKNIAAGYAMLLAGCNSIHTFFMSTAIDVVMTDKAGSVVYLRENMGPWQFAGSLKAKDTLEMKAGAIKETGIKIKDTMSIA